MGRITPSKAKPKPKLIYEAKVGTKGEKWATHQDELWAEVARIAGFAGYKTLKRHWSHIVVAFDTKEKADQLDAWMRAEKFNEPKDMGPFGPPAWFVAREACERWRSLEWAVRTGHVDAIVQAYRSARATEALHMLALLEAGSIVEAVAPTVTGVSDIDIAEFVLKWVAQDDPARFWGGAIGTHWFRR